MCAFFLVAFFASFFALFSAAVPVVFADDGAIRGALSGTAPSAGFANVCATAACVSTIIGMVINVIVGLLGIALVGYILYAGFLWMTAGGESKQIEDAMKVARNAVIGIFVVGFSYTIASVVLNFVSSSFTPTEVSTPTTEEEVAVPISPTRSGATAPDPFAEGCSLAACAPLCVSQRCSSLTSTPRSTCEHGCSTQCEARCAR